MRLKTLCRVYHSKVKLSRWADRSGHSQCPANDYAPNPKRHIVRFMAPAWILKHNLRPRVTGGKTF